MLRRKEFDRSQEWIDIFKGLVPDHHITMKMGDQFWAQRRLIQDPMTPSFLTKVAAPHVFTCVQNFISMWHTKLVIADGRPFDASEDVVHVAFDAIISFAFGESYPHRTTKSQAEMILSLSGDQVGALRASCDIEGENGAIAFPKAALHPSAEAFMELCDAFESVTSRPVPQLQWWLRKRQAAFQHADKLSSEHIREQVYLAVSRMEDKPHDSSDSSGSGIDAIVARELSSARKEKRQPNYWTSVMRDEVFGFIAAGHDTTATTVMWGLKLLTDHPEKQSALRMALESAHADCVSGIPSVSEIVHTSIPYLDATIEEIVRCASPAPLMSREAMVDTTILGYHIPKGTNVVLFHRGPSIFEPGFEVEEAIRSQSSQAAAKERRVNGKVEWDPNSLGEFLPERWLVQDESKDLFDSNAGPNFGFGYGARGCYGRRLAHLEMRILFTLLVWEFELLPCHTDLSNYDAIDSLTHKPRQTYVRLKKARATAAFHH